MRLTLFKEAGMVSEMKFNKDHITEQAVDKAHKMIEEKKYRRSVSRASSTSSGGVGGDLQIKRKEGYFNR